MSQSRPYISELIKLLGLDPEENERKRQESIEKCIHCHWGSITGDTIFCPFTKCEKHNQVFANALHGGSKHAENIS